MSKDEYELVDSYSLADKDYPSIQADEINVYYNQSNDEVILEDGEGNRLDRGDLDFSSVLDIQDCSEQDIINTLNPGNGATIIGP